MSRFLVRLWKFDQHRYGEEEVYMKFDPAGLPKSKKEVKGETVNISEKEPRSFVELVS